MFCPSGVNSGLIEIVGPIQQTDLQHITVQQPPLSIKFAPRSTAPTLSGSRINEAAPTDNICRYRGKKYVLSDIQLTKPMHKGFTLPGMTIESSAELILSFHSTASNTIDELSEYAGVLLCLPIYASGAPAHDEYLTQLLNTPDPSQPSSVNPPTIQSLFYKDTSDLSQTSFAYKTCFETGTAENNVHSHSLYVVVFPNGVHMNPTSFQSLLSHMGQRFSAYSIPVSIRGPESTVTSYRYESDGKRHATKFSDDGVPYTSPLSSCSEEFKRIEYFAFPPQLDSSSFSINKSKKLYKKTQYKCVPFDQLRDVSGEYVKLGNKSLATILAEQKEVQSAQESSSDPKGPSDASLSTAEWELVGEIVGTGVAVAIVGFIAYKVWEWKNQE